MGGLAGSGATESPKPAPGARRNATVQRLPSWLRRTLSWLVSRWPGRVAIQAAAGFVRVGIFDRSMTIAAQFFSSVFPILIVFATLRSGGNLRSMEEASHMPQETQVLVNEAVQGAPGTSFGILGVLIVLLSATSLSRALTRAFLAIWQLPRPRTSIAASVWRWLAALMVLILSLVVVRTLGARAADLPPPGVWLPATSLVGNVAAALFVPWMLLSGLVRPRLLVSGAVIFGCLMLLVRPVSDVWFPRTLKASADHYGSIGVAFTYLAWLYVVAFFFLATAVVGQVISTDQGRLGLWINGGQVPQDE